MYTVQLCDALPKRGIPIMPRRKLADNLKILVMSNIIVEVVGPNYTCTTLHGETLWNVIVGIG